MFNLIYILYIHKKILNVINNCINIYLIQYIFDTMLP